MTKKGANPYSQSGGFGSLTEKQIAVLDLLANGRTSKEIASALTLSESAVNRRIELLRSRFDGITRLELARRYREWTTSQASQAEAIAAGVETDRQSLRLAATPVSSEASSGENPRTPLASEKDTAELSGVPARSDKRHPRVVPGVFDGENATLTRGAAIAVMLAAIIASLVFGLAAAGAITEALGG